MGVIVTVSIGLPPLADDKTDPGFERSLAPASYGTLWHTTTYATPQAQNRTQKLAQKLAQKGGGHPCSTLVARVLQPHINSHASV
jgi:hypothetical protein